LIVIAIIGILAGVILVSTSSARNKAILAGAKQVGKSTMPHVAECAVVGGTVQAASNGGAICDAQHDTKANFANLASSSTLSSCSYTGSTAAQVKIDCGTIGNIICIVSTGVCN
jgi:hypothetical protein